MLYYVRSLNLDEYKVCKMDADKLKPMFTKQFLWLINVLITILFLKNTFSKTKLNTLCRDQNHTITKRRMTN